MDIQLHRVIHYFPKHVEENLRNVHSLHLRHSKNNEAMEKARKRLNSYAATRTIGMGGAYIKYPNIYLANTELWSAD
jgi:hypothetical protein